MDDPQYKVRCDNCRHWDKTHVYGRSDAWCGLCRAVLPQIVVMPGLQTSHPLKGQWPTTLDWEWCRLFQHRDDPHNEG